MLLVIHRAFCMPCRTGCVFMALRNHRASISTARVGRAVSS